MTGQARGSSRVCKVLNPRYEIRWLFSQDESSILNRPVRFHTVNPGCEPGDGTRWLFARCKGCRPAVLDSRLQRQVPDASVLIAVRCNARPYAGGRAGAGSGAETAS